MTKPICSVSECENTSKTRGYCRKHYHRVLRYGHPLGMPTPRQPRKCSVEGCTNKHDARGYCKTHYAQWRAKQTKPCSIEGCTRSIHAKGWCKFHYRKWLDHGDPLGGGRHYATPEESFAANTEWQGDCLVWVSATKRSGYGIIWVNGRFEPAHRYAWEREHGKIPDEMVIDHICWNKPCVNTKHLRVATRAQNNSYLSGPHKDNKSSGVRNVRRHASGGWNVVIQKDYKTHSFGVYSTIEEAAEIAEAKRAELFGEYAGRS